MTAARRPQSDDRAGDLVVRRFSDAGWADQANEGDNSAERLARAKQAGYRRKQLLAGEGDVHLTYVRMGPGFTVDPHSHDAQEIIHIIGGSLTPDGSSDELTRGDSLVIPSGHIYGFRTGDDGVEFLIYRPRAAGIDHVT
jgi:quercetin dioxygenase-like cupin family protein